MTAANSSAKPKEPRRWTLHFVKRDVRGLDGVPYTVGHVAMGRYDECPGADKEDVVAASHYDALSARVEELEKDLAAMTETAAVLELQLRDARQERDTFLAASEGER